MLYLLSNIEYQINSMPYSRHSQLAPSHFQFARGIEADLNFNDYLESLEGDDKSNKLHPLTPYIKSLEQLRNEILAEIFTKRTSVHKIHDEDLYLPFSGDMVIALTGSFKTSEIAVVEQGVEDVINNPANTDPVKQSQEISQRKVKIRTKLGEAKLYPVTSLCPLVSAENKLEWDKRNPNKLTSIPGKIPYKFICNGLRSFLFSPQTKEIKMNNYYLEVMMNQISFRIFYFSLNKLSNATNSDIVSYFYVFSQFIRKNQIWPHDHAMEIYQNLHDRRVLVLLMHALYCPLSNLSQLSVTSQPVDTYTKMKRTLMMLLSSMACVMPAPVAEPDAFSVVGSMYPMFATNFSVQLHPEEALRCLITEFCMKSLFQDLSFNSNDHESNLGDGEYLKGAWASKFSVNLTNIFSHACQLISIPLLLITQGIPTTRPWSPYTRIWRWEPVSTPTSGPRCWGSHCSPGAPPPLASTSSMARDVGLSHSSRGRGPGPGPTMCPSLRWPHPGGWSAVEKRPLMCTTTTQLPPGTNKMKKRSSDHDKMFIFNGQALFTPGTIWHFVSLYIKKHFLLTRSSLSVFRVNPLCMCVNGSTWRSPQKNVVSSLVSPPPPK